MPTLAVMNFNIVCSVLGGFITLFGLVSYLFKEKFYLSEACMFILKPLFLSCVSKLIIGILSDILTRRSHLLPSRYESCQTSRLYSLKGQSRCCDVILQSPCAWCTVGPCRRSTPESISSKGVETTLAPPRASYDCHVAKQQSSHLGHGSTPPVPPCFGYWSVRHAYRSRSFE
jgi:hypothetical protein